jgi:hypothetical protein
LLTFVGRYDLTTSTTPSNALYILDDEPNSKSTQIHPNPPKPPYNRNNRIKIILETRPLETNRDLNKLIMNYLVIEGYKDAAAKFSKESGLEPTVQLESIEDRMNIRNAIQRGDIEDAIERVNDLDPEVGICCSFLFLLWLVLVWNWLFCGCFVGSFVGGVQLVKWRLGDRHSRFFFFGAFIR